MAAFSTNVLDLSASVQIFEVCLFSLILVCSLSTTAYLKLVTTSWSLGYTDKHLLGISDEVSVDVAVRMLVTSLFAAVVLVCVTVPCIAFITADNLNLAALVAAQLYQHWRMSMFWCLVIAASIHLASQSLRRNRIWIGPVSFRCSKTMVRKIYHIAVVTMFSPAVIVMDAETLFFLSLSMGGAVCLFLAAEFLRCFLLANALSGHTNGHSPAIDLLKALDAFLASFQEHSETSYQQEQQSRILMRPIIFSHISLLLGVGLPIWLYCRYALDPLAAVTSHHTSTMDAGGSGLDLSLRPLLIIGMATVGVGDTAASVFGSLFGRLRWPNSRKTYLGTVAAFVSMEIYALWMTALWRLPPKLSMCMAVTFFLAALAEAVTTENDNILLPLYAAVVYLSLRYCIHVL